jgi:hypothetical protein
MGLINNLRDAKNYLMIDKDNLDDCVIKQAVLFYDVSENLNKAKERYDQEKYNLSLVESRLLQEVRKKVLRKDVKKKPTEGDLKEQVYLDTEYKEAKEDLLEEKEKVSQWESMRDAYSQRSFMIKEIVKLWESDYYETGTVKNSESRTFRKKQSKQRRKLNVS